MKSKSQSKATHIRKMVGCLERICCFLKNHDDDDQGELNDKNAELLTFTYLKVPPTLACSSKCEYLVSPKVVTIYFLILLFILKYF